MERITLNLSRAEANALERHLSHLKLPKTTLLTTILTQLQGELWGYDEDMSDYKGWADGDPMDFGHS